MTTALLEFLPVGTIPIKIWLHRLQNEFHLTMASYFIIYSATTRGEKFSAVEMFQLLFPKEKNKQTIKQNKTTNLVTSCLEHMDSNAHCFFLWRYFSIFMVGRKQSSKPVIQILIKQEKTHSFSLKEANFLYMATIKLKI